MIAKAQFLGYFVVGLFVAALLMNGDLWPRIHAATTDGDPRELMREQPRNAATVHDVKQQIPQLRDLFTPDNKQPARPVNAGPGRGGGGR